MKKLIILFLLIFPMSIYGFDFKFLPYLGAKYNVDLGNYGITAASVTATGDIQAYGTIYQNGIKVSTSTGGGSSTVYLALSSGTYVDGLITSSPTWQVKGALQSGNYFNDVKVSSALNADKFDGGTSTEWLEVIFNTSEFYYPHKWDVWDSTNNLKGLIDNKLDISSGTTITTLFNALPNTYLNISSGTTITALLNLLPNTYLNISSGTTITTLFNALPNTYLKISSGTTITN